MSCPIDTEPDERFSKAIIMPTRKDTLINSWAKHLFSMIQCQEIPALILPDMSAAPIFTRRVCMCVCVCAECRGRG